MRKIALLLLIAGTPIAAPAAAATFSVDIGSPVGTPSCGSASATGGSAVARELVCTPLGGASLLDGAAFSNFGHVGGDTHAAIGSGYFGTAFGIGTTSTFSDFVTFEADDPNVTHVPIAANLAFSGTMNSTSPPNANVSLFYHLGGATGFIFYSANDRDGVVRNDFALVNGTVSGGSSNALLRTGFVLAPVDTPLLMTLQLSTFAGVGGSGSPESAMSSFSNSFEVPIGSDAFVLPAGVTANAGDWLVNNRRLDPNAAAIPEPATWAMMLLGFGGVGYALRRRTVRVIATRTPAVPVPRPS